MRLSLSLSIVASLLAGCAKDDPLFCTSEQACLAGLDYCDVEGTCEASGFHGNTCIAEPCWDGGNSGGDAAVSIDASPCTPGTWSRNTVDANVDSGRHNSLVVDAWGRAHIVYHQTDQQEFDLMYATQDSSGMWSSSKIDDGGFYVQLRARAADSNLHVAHGQLATMRYGIFDGMDWSMETVVTGESYDIGLALTPDLIHFAYFGFDGGDNPRHVSGTPGAWGTPSPIVQGGTGLGPSIAVDAIDGLHAAWEEGSDTLYAYRPNNGTFGSAETVDGTTGSYPVITTDAAGVPHVVYKGTNDQALHHAVRVDTSWTRRVVDSSTSVGQSRAIAVDADGGVHIAYSDDANANLKYAYRAEGGNFYQLETVDSDGSVGGNFMSVAVDDGGGVHISYYDQGNQDIKYAVRCP